MALGLKLPVQAAAAREMHHVSAQRSLTITIAGKFTTAEQKSSSCGWDFFFLLPYRYFHIFQQLFQRP
jgi:hypothetical protein